ncbi:MAG: hypothetical protein JEZ07_08985 [Phycisphaerae bacterium]|nr:hypothetical protein [Phycisphaerae bacterium]
MAFEKAVSGQPIKIPASDYNAAMAAAEAYQKQISNPSVNINPDDADVVMVRNSSGGNLVRYAVLQIAGPMFEPAVNLDSFKDYVGFDGEAVSDDTLPFVIVQEPIAAGEVGRALVTGITVSPILVTDDTHKYAGVASGVPFLQSSDSGTVTILWKQSGTGVKWAMVRLGTAGVTESSSDFELVPVRIEEDIADGVSKVQVKEYNSLYNDFVGDPFYVYIKPNHATITDKEDVVPWRTSGQPGLIAKDCHGSWILVRPDIQPAGSCI